MSITNKIRREIGLADYTTIQLGGNAHFFVEIASTDELIEALAWTKQEQLPWFILGGGSNTIFADGGFAGLVMKIAIRGIHIESQGHETALVNVGAGEIWDEVVARTVEHGLSGIETLSGIPGLAGTAPVQNIGAYGTELDTVVDHVMAYDTQTNKLVRLERAHCDFTYRSSMFRTSAKGRYIITELVLLLSSQPPQPPTYRDVAQYFEKHGITQPSLRQIREAILDIRRDKFPSPSKTPNAGSFFKNPIVTRAKYESIATKYPEVNHPVPGWSQAPRWFLDDGRVKLAAAWLIQSVGLKGYQHLHTQVDPHHGLVLENIGGATRQELDELRDLVINKVQADFGIQLEPEPELVN